MYFGNFRYVYWTKTVPKYIGQKQPQSISEISDVHHVSCIENLEVILRALVILVQL